MHLAFLLSGGLGLVQKAEFGMAGSQAGYEVDLVAALPGEYSADMKNQDEQTKIINESRSMASNSHKALNTGPVGDGSSPISGNDPTTRHSGGGRFTQARPGYFRNPPPVYPEEARRQGREGLVLLRVTVNDEGKPESINILQSSGFVLLDDAAISAVKEWKFKPARFNGIPVESQVEVPMQFKLDS